MGQRLSTGNFQLLGEAFPVVERIVRSATNLNASFSASKDGSLLISSTIIGDQLTWFDRNGKRLGTTGNPGLHFYPHISPDQHTLAVDSEDAQTFSPYLWLFPMEGGAPRRFTFTASLRPMWSPRGSRIAYEAQNSALYVKTSAGAENETLLLAAANIPDDYRVPCDWSKDEKLLIYSQKEEGSKYQLWSCPYLETTRLCHSFARNSISVAVRCRQMGLGSLIRRTTGQERNLRSGVLGDTR